MKRILLATVSGLALTGSAAAADMRMPVKAPSAMAAPLWAGSYIGLNGGAAWHQLKTNTSDAATGAFFDSARVRTTGGTFGGQVGYNWQSQSFVYGLEADLNWVGGKGSDQHIANNGIGFPVIHTTKLSWLATMRARGGVAFGRTLLFATGGLAVGHVKNDWDFGPAIICPGNPGCLHSNYRTRLGWTAGGGIEHFVSQNMTVKAEALYVDLGRKTMTLDGYTTRFKNTAVLGRLGVNLKW